MIAIAVAAWQYVVGDDLGGELLAQERHVVGFAHFATEQLGEIERALFCLECREIGGRSMQIGLGLENVL